MSTQILHLDDMWDYCPQSWKNFTNYIEYTEFVIDGNGVSEYLDQYLAIYNAKYVHGVGVMAEDYVEFETAEDAVAFRLRFG